MSASAVRTYGFCRPLAAEPEGAPAPRWPLRGRSPLSRRTILRRPAGRSLSRASRGARGCRALRCRAEEQRDRPVRDDSELPRQQRQLEQVVRSAWRTSRGTRGARKPNTRQAFEAAERRALAEHPVAVWPGAPPRFFASRRAWRSACWLVGGSGDRAMRAFGTRAPSPSAQRRSRPRTRRNSSTCDTLSLVEWQGPSPSSGFAMTPAVQTSVRVGMGVPSAGEHDSVLGRPTRASCSRRSRHRAARAERAA